MAIAFALPSQLNETANYWWSRLVVLKSGPNRVWHSLHQGIHVNQKKLNNGQASSRLIIAVISGMKRDKKRGDKDVEAIPVLV